MTERLEGAAILVTGINYAPETTGIAPYTTAMARTLHDAGAEVTVLTGVPHYPQWKVQDTDLLRTPWTRQDQHGIDLVRVRHHVPERPDLVGRARMETSFYRGARRVLRQRREPFDAVISVTPSLSGAAAALAAPVRAGRGVLVQDLTGAGALESGSAGALVASAIGAVESRIIQSFDLVGVIAPRFGELLESHGLDVSATVQLPNFTHITAPDTTRAQARASLGWEQDTFTVVHTGNMGMKQGLENVVDAAREARRRGLAVRFVLVGDGNQREHLAAVAADVPPSHLQLVPPLSDEQYPLALAAADVLLLNERAGVREMCLPSKLTSYVAASRPIVAAVEIDGISGTTLAATDAAEICAPGDPGALVDTVRELSTDQERRKVLVKKATAFGEDQYSPDAAARRYREFAARLLAEHRTTRRK